MANDSLGMAKNALMQRMGFGRKIVEMEIDVNPVASSMFEVSARLVSDMSQHMDVVPFDHRAFTDAYATVEDMQVWAAGVMAQKPHFVINGDYMHRWYILPRNDRQNVYLHHLLRSDEDLYHDHPWDSTSFIIKGGFWEHLPGVPDPIWRAPGDVIHRKGADAHYLELPKGETSVSLFFTGPKIRDWGFWCGARWVHWEEYTGGYHDGRSEKGAGCGEP